MIEAYAVGISLTLESNVPAVLARTAEQFEQLEQIVKRVQASVKSLAGSMQIAGKAGTDAAAAWSRAAAAMERAAAAASGASTKMNSAGPRGAAGGSEAPPHDPFRRTYRSSLGALVPYVGAAAGASGGGGGQPPGPDPIYGGRAFVDGPGLGALVAPPGAGGGGGGGGGPLGPNTPGAAFGGGPIPLNYRAPGAGAAPGKPIDHVAAGVAAYIGADILKNVMEQAIGADSILAKMHAQAAFSDKDVDASAALARSIVKTTPGMGYEEALDLILQTASFTGDAKEALALTPALARDAQILSLFGKKDAIGQVEAGIKAGELTGLTTADGKIDIPKLTAFINGLTNSAVSGGGTMDIGRYLTGIRQMGAGADAASTDFLLNVLPAYMKIMGESKAGTALSSFQQSMLGAKGGGANKKLFAEQKRLGLRELNGQLSSEDEDLISKDMNAYIVTRVLPALFKDGIRTPAQIRAELPKFLPRSTMERLVAAGIFDEGVITKEADRNRAQQKQGGPLGDTLLQNSPANQVKAFMETFHLLEISFGDAAMKPFLAAMNDLAGVLAKIAAWAKDNPDGARKALEGLAGAVLFLGGAAVIGALEKLGGAGGRLALLGAGIGILSEKLDSIPQWLIGMVTGAALGARIGGVPGAIVGGGIGAGVGDPLNPDPEGVDAFVRKRLGQPSLPSGPSSHPDVHHESYNTPSGAAGRPPIQTIVYIQLDGRHLAKVVSEEQGRAMSLPPAGSTRFDGRMTETSPGNSLRA